MTPKLELCRKCKHFSNYEPHENNPRTSHFDFVQQKEYACIETYMHHYNKGEQDWLETDKIGWMTDAGFLPNEKFSLETCPYRLEHLVL